MKRRFSLATFLVVLVLTGLIAVTAAQGGSDDPLVTLSYLTDIFKPQLLSDVKATLADSEKEVIAQIDAEMDKLEQDASKAIAQGNTTNLSTAAFEVVTVGAGKTMTVDSGCEVLLRSGTGTVSASSSVGFIDSTDGTFLENGQAFTANHLYLTTTDGRGFVCSAEATLLVRGGYQIS